MITTRNVQIRKHLWPLCIMIGSLLGGLLALGVYPRMAHTASMAPATKAHVGSFEFDPVSVIDTGAAVVPPTVPVAASSQGMAPSPEGSTVQVSGHGGSTVSVIDPESDRITHTIEVGDAPRKVDAQRTAASTAKGSAKVSIVNFAFTPAAITIAPGESVTWTNDDGAPHGLEYHDGEKGTDLLLPGASFTRRFDRPGTYDYNCSVHPYMTGRVIVRAQ